MVAGALGEDTPRAVRHVDPDGEQKSVHVATLFHQEEEVNVVENGRVQYQATQWIHKRLGT